MKPVIDVTPAIESTEHLLRVVDNREEERVKARARYLCLMRVHIEKQLKQCIEREKLFLKRKEKRAKREKVHVYCWQSRANYNNKWPVIII